MGINGRDLDNYITGHYGEDQFREEDEDTGHAFAFFTSPLSNAYVYDPADDGPEVETITRILASYPTLDPKAQSDIRASLDKVASIIFASKAGGL